MERRYRVLALAYGYGAHDISESYTAFCLLREIGSRHDVTVLTKDAATGTSSVKIGRIPTQNHFVPGSLRRALKLDYFSFNARAWRTVRSGTLGRFDLCHHVSPISIRYPDRLASLDTPFIWGPVGGSIAYPKALADVARRDPPLMRLRVIDALRLKIDPLLRATMQRAARIVVTSSGTAELIPEPHRSKTVVIGEGVDANALMRPCASPLAGELGDYIFSSARLVPFKGLDLLIRAYAQAQLDSKLIVTGEGPERENLQRLARDLCVESKIRFLGSVGKPENLALMECARFCVFPSLKEAFGHVNVEAMAKAKAVIAVAHGGPKDIVRHGVTGMLVQPDGAESLVAQLAAAMKQLAADPALCTRMGNAGRRRVREVYDWPAVGSRYLSLYDEVLQERSVDPERQVLQ